jgi:hypothetical protein
MQNYRSMFSESFKRLIKFFCFKKINKFNEPHWNKVKLGTDVQERKFPTWLTRARGPPSQDGGASRIIGGRIVSGHKGILESRANARTSRRGQKLGNCGWCAGRKRQMLQRHHNNGHAYIRPVCTLRT